MVNLNESFLANQFTNTRHRIISGVGFFAGFAIPISTAGENIGVFFLICLLAIPDVRRELRITLMHPVVLFCLTLYTLFIFGTLYTSAPEHAPRMLAKMRGYLLIPVIFAACSITAVRQSIILGFLSAAALSLLVSLISYLFGYPVFQGNEGNWTVFRTHSYHNLFIAWLLLAITSGLLTMQFNKKYLPIIGITLLSGIFDVFFLVQGRTGHLLLLLMLMLLFFLWNPKRGMIAGLLIIFVGVPVLWMGSKTIHDRFQLAQKEIHNFAENKQEETSLGLRLSWYTASIPIVLNAPILGHGTGSFATELRRQNNVSLNTNVKVSPLLATANPHNDYLWIAVELGLVGVAVLLLIFYSALRSATQLPDAQKWMVWMIVGSMGIGSLTNSFITDNITGTGFVVLLSALLAGPLWTEEAIPRERGFA